MMKLEEEELSEIQFTCNCDFLGERLKLSHVEFPGRKAPEGDVSCEEVFPSSPSGGRWLIFKINYRASSNTQEIIKGIRKGSLICSGRNIQLISSHIKSSTLFFCDITLEEFIGKTVDVVFNKKVIGAMLAYKEEAGKLVLKEKGCLVSEQILHNIRCGIYIK